MKPNSYHNTNNEQGVLLFESEKKAQTQETEILKIFKKHPKMNLCAYTIQGLFSKDVPITSIRRAISNLANPEKYGLIEKTDVMTVGLYGKMVHTWILKPVV